MGRVRNSISIPGGGLSMKTTQTIRLLVIDDDACDRHLIRRYASGLGLRIDFFEAATIPDAIAICEQESIDLVLLDMRLTHSQGAETLAEFRRSLPKIRLIALSGLLPESSDELASTYQVAEFLEKSVITKDLLGRLVRDAENAKNDGRPSSRDAEPSVWLIDDDDADLYMLKKVMTLASDGPIKTETACDGLDAIERLVELTKAPEPNLPVLITLDLNMPRKDGFQTLSELKKHPELCKIPVIIHSTCCGDDKRSRSLEQADAIVPKPSNRKEIDALVDYFREHWLSPTRQERKRLPESV